MIKKTDSYIYTFESDQKADTELIGRKALSINKINQLDIPNPKSFVLTSLAFDDFLLVNNLAEEIVNVLAGVRPFAKEMAIDASGKIANLIISSPIPDIILHSIHSAYRSLNKGGSPFCNIYFSHIIEDRFLPNSDKERFFQDIRGIDEVVKKIKLAWMSLFSPEAIEERVNTYYDGPITMSLYFSKNVRAEISGTIFSIPPITREHDMMEIYAIYGMNDGDVRLETDADSYKIQVRTKKIVEKNIIPQKIMHIRTGNTNSKAFQKVAISNAWQRRQKIEDSRILEVFEIAHSIEKKFKVPIEVDWGVEAGRFYITDVREFIPTPQGDPLAKLDEEEYLRKFATKSSPQEEIKTDKSLKDLENEIFEMMDNDSPKYSSVNKDRTELLPLELPAKINKAMSWEKKYDLKTKLLLDLSKFNSASLTALNFFNGAFFDGTELILKEGELPEKTIKSTQESLNLIHNFAAEISTVAKSMPENDVIYQFSKINEYEYKLLNLNPSNYEYFGDERFIDNPTALKYEVQSVKFAKREYDCKNLSISFPYVRNISNLMDLKAIVSAEGLRRSSHMKFYAEVAIPSFAQDIESIPEDIIDGLIIDYTTLLKLLVYRNTFRKVDHAVALKLIKNLLNFTKKRKMDLAVKFDTIEDEIIEDLVHAGVRKMIFTFAPEEEIVKIIEKAEV